MSQAEEKFMEDRRKMEFFIKEFYQSCEAIGIDDDGFIEDITEAIKDATNKKVELELN